MPARKSGYLVAIPATGHRTPAAFFSSRRVIEEQSTRRVGAEPQTRGSPLRHNLRGGAGHGREQPIQSTFPRGKFDAPLSPLMNEFIVAFGDAEDLIDGLNRVAGNWRPADDCRESILQRAVKTLRFGEEGFRALRIRLGQGKKFAAAFSRADLRKEQEAQQVFPGKVRRGTELVAEVDGQAAAKEARVRGRGQHLESGFGLSSEPFITG